MKARTFMRCVLVCLLLTESLAFAQDEEAAPPKLILKPAGEKKAEPEQPGALDKIGKRTATEHKTVDIFKGKSWYVAPPKPKPLPPPPPPPPPPPIAPPLPYAFMGTYLGKDGKIIVYLTRGDQVYAVSPGDVLEGTYRVQGIEAGQLILIYLPLNIQQTIRIGEAS